MCYWDRGSIQICWCTISFSSRKVITPGGITLLKSHGTNLLTPALAAASTSGIWSRICFALMALMRVSKPCNALASSSTSPERLPMTMGMLRAASALTAGLVEEEGCTSAETSYITDSAARLLRSSKGRVIRGVQMKNTDVGTVF